MKLVGVDPGPVQSAYVSLDGDGMIWDMGYGENVGIEAHLRKITAGDRCYIEMVASYGKPVGRDVFETVYWIGRFARAWDGRRDEAPQCQLNYEPAQRIYRKDVKLHLCGDNNRSKDSHVRQALIDRFGGVEGKAKAVGRKKSPGPLYGVKGDLWAALAVAVTAYDRRKVEGFWEHANRCAEEVRSWPAWKKELIR